MNVRYISPLSELEAEIKPLFSNEYMLAFFKKFCDIIQTHLWGFKTGKNAKYEAKDFLRVFFYSELTGRSVKSGSERLNKYLLKKKRKNGKTYADGRKQREIPHQTDVNKFLRRIGLQKARDILRECLDNQLIEALQVGLISRKVNVLVDFTEHDYYGKRRDKMIKGTNRGRGTNKMRHYLVFSILSKGLHLFAGLEHVAKEQKKVPMIVKFLEHLRALGFEVNRVMMDREFYNVELLDKIKGLKSNVLIPAKAYKVIKQIVEEYLKGTGKRIRTYEFSSVLGAKLRFFQRVYLVLGIKKGYTLLGVKREFQRGTLSLDDAKKLVYAIITTEKPRGASSSWASRISRLYKKRWNLETGFSDLNRMGHRWKSKYDNTRYLDLLVRMLLYNSWKINRAFLENCSIARKKRQEWTLQDNRDALEELFLEA